MVIFQMMRVTIDRAGRVVIPKPIRLSLGIEPDSELEAITDGTGIRLEPVATHQRSVGTEDGLPMLAFVPGVVLTDDDVQRLRDELQR